MKHSLTLIIFIVLVLNSYPVMSNEFGEPPFGVQFGQKFQTSKHKTIQRRGNVRSVKLKTADRPDDTEEIKAEICDNYGLQIITWRSHIRSQSAASASHNEILKNFKKKYGTPKIRKKTAFWVSNHFNIVAKIREKDGTFQNQIRYFGPKNEPCLKKFLAHQSGRKSSGDKTKDD